MADEDNTEIIETTGESDDGFGYVKKVNKYQQEQGIDPPLTVIEFSMTDACRDELQVLLDDFVTGTRKLEEDKDFEHLKQAIEDHFPKEVLEYFRTQDKENPNTIAPYVYCTICICSTQPTKAHQRAD